MSLPPVVSPEEWETARAELLAAEKAATRARDALAAMRRRQPMVRVTDHVLTGADGPIRLSEAFAGRPQLVVYHFMLHPGSDHVCEGCSMFTDNLGHPDHLHARGVTRILTSPAPIEEIERVRRRMGWTHPWYSAPEFTADMGVGDGFGLSVFLHVPEDRAVYRTYFTTGRGVEALGSNWTFLDLVPYGRQETWEDTPPGRPQSAPYVWWRRHGEYGEQEQNPAVTASGGR
jgi:predicted dithiol-disulfide oxidoreductase (DUF899 family)